MSKFNRILLKLSGESLMGKQSFGIDPVRLGEYAHRHRYRWRQYFPRT